MSDPILQEILEKLKIIEEKIDRLADRLEDVEISTGIMDEHVQWVNGIHNIVKAPLYSALNAVNTIMYPLSGTMVDIEEVPNAPMYSRRLTHVKDELTS